MCRHPSARRLAGSDRMANTCSNRSTDRSGVAFVADQLVIRGAREHNLKDISLDLPRDSLIVFTGLSGSGKSSLAFDTIFAEGQRRYVESLSAYARQFLGQMDKPDVDFIEGLSPAVSIDQKSTSKNPRSTVGTITEVYDYLRLLYARAGRPHCPVCGAPIERQTPQQIVDRVLQLEEAPASRSSRPSSAAARANTSSSSAACSPRASAGPGSTARPSSSPSRPKLEKQKKHTIEVVVDRLSAKPSLQAPAHRLRRDGAQPRLRPGRLRPGRPRRQGPSQGDEVLRADVVPQRARHRDRRPRAAVVLVQLTVRRLPDVPRPRHPHGGRPGAGHLRPAGAPSARASSDRGRAPTSPTTSPACSARWATSSAST